LFSCIFKKELIDQIIAPRRIDNQYPFEFTVQLKNQPGSQFSLILNKTNGEKEESKQVTLGVK
jgi:hypothetical protein